MYCPWRQFAKRDPSARPAPNSSERRPAKRSVLERRRLCDALYIFILRGLCCRDYSERRAVPVSYSLAPRCARLAVRRLPRRLPRRVFPGIAASCLCHENKR